MYIFSLLPKTRKIYVYNLFVFSSSDSDFGVNAEIEYYKLDGNGTSFININNTTGNVI